MRVCVRACVCVSACMRRVCMCTWRARVCSCVYVRAAWWATSCLFLYFCVSHIIQLTPQQQSAEPRNSAGAEALIVARRPNEASREKTRPPPVSRGSSPCYSFGLEARGLESIPPLPYITQPHYTSW